MSNNDERNCAAGETRSGIPLEPAHERTLRIERKPAQQDGREIHPRRPLPLVPGTADPDEDETSESDGNDR
ncbi:MAG TPA: hypothetical protein VJ901_10485 [Thermoanaerobaculia bacterium]|nr:hypothetical protein [Thermoanaerobaculia bacterium]